MKKEKCTWCDEDIGEEDEMYLTMKGDKVCGGCFESEWEHASTIHKFSPNGHETARFTANFGTEETENGDFANDEDAMPTPIESQKWVNSDGWRGYTEWEVMSGYEKITDGWITGYPDETTPTKRELGEYFEDLLEGKICPPVPIYWVFGVTSNVFSSASCIIARKGDREAIEKWLLEINGGLEEFANKFN